MVPVVPRAFVFLVPRVPGAFSGEMTLEWGFVKPVRDDLLASMNLAINAHFSSK
jgi:hypothetical protein